MQTFFMYLYKFSSIILCLLVVSVSDVYLDEEHSENFSRNRIYLNSIFQFPKISIEMERRSISRLENSIFILKSSMYQLY